MNTNQLQQNTFSKVTAARIEDARTITHSQYIALVRKWDRDNLIRGAASASAQNNGATIKDGVQSDYLPWNISGMAVTAICRGTAGGPTPSNTELQELIWQFGNVFDNAEVNEDDTDVARMIARIAHQQMPFQKQLLNQWARPQALFADTPFPANYKPEVMVEGWLEDLLDCTLSEFIGSAFALWASAIAVDGKYGRSVWDGSLDPLLKILPLSRIDEIGLRHFVTDVPGIKSARRAAQKPGDGSEKWAYNPLIYRPFLRDIEEGMWIAPSTDLLTQKASALGIVYEGIERWGTKFSRDLGRLFESYVGRNLALTSGATLVGEIGYGTKKSPRRSTDWFWVFDSLVVLVEVKAGAPNQSTRQSVGEVFAGLTDKFSKAIKHLDQTASALISDRVAFASIPADRPIVGLVVTLGDFPTAEMGYAYGVFGTSNIPVAFIHSGELEALVAQETELIVSVIREAADATGPNNLIDSNRLKPRLKKVRNEIIEKAWGSNPVLDYITKRRAADSKRREAPTVSS